MNNLSVRLSLGQQIEFGCLKQIIFYISVSDSLETF